MTFLLRRKKGKIGHKAWWRWGDRSTEGKQSESCSSCLSGLFAQPSKSRSWFWLYTITAIYCNKTSGKTTNVRNALCLCMLSRLLGALCHSNNAAKACKESPSDSFVSQQLCSCQFLGIPSSLQDAKCQLREHPDHYPITDKTNIVFPLNQLYIEFIWPW